MTPAEARVWKIVRARGLLGLKFRRQHPLRQFIVDFYCAERKLVLELEGKIHSSVDGVARDRERTATLQGWGLTVLRIRNEDAERERLEILVARITRCPTAGSVPLSRRERGQG